MPKTDLSPQQQLNARAKAIGATINNFAGQIVTMADGTWYKLESQAQLYALIKKLEEGGNTNDN